MRLLGCVNPFANVSIKVLTALCLLVFLSAPASGQTRGAGGVVRVNTQTGNSMELYRGSYALLIGISKYQFWPSLESVPGEIAEVGRALRSQGFVVRTLHDPNSKQLENAFEDFIGKYGYSTDNRLLFFYSGHGASREDGTMGYLVPADAPLIRKDPTGFKRKAISMSQVLTWCREMEAKHALFLFDSCFSGSIFESKGVGERPPYITQYTAKPVRYFITAGGPKEQVPAQSTFTPSFVRGLRGEADINKDGYITSTELGMYLHDKVMHYRTGQTPQHGKIRDPKLDAGEFVFVLDGAATGGEAQPVTPRVDDPKSQKIARLIKEGDALFATGNLSTPRGSNAAQRYQAVLMLDPLNRNAQSGLRRIIGKYVAWAESRIKAGHFDKAEEYLNRADQVREGDQRVMAMWDKLHEARQKAKVSVVEEKMRLEEARLRAEAERKRKEQAEAERKKREREWAETELKRKLEEQRLAELRRKEAEELERKRMEAAEAERKRKLEEKRLAELRRLAALEKERIRKEAEERKRREKEREKERHPASIKKSFTNYFGMKFIKIPAGYFTMGSPLSEAGRYKRENQHGVNISRPFYMQTTEVTQGQWRAVMGSNPAHFKHCGDNCPVEMVSWDDAQRFIRRLNKKSGVSKYRLPTEAEWEYAARAGAKGATFSSRFRIISNNNAKGLSPYAWYGGNSCASYKGASGCDKWPDKQISCSTCGTHPVAQKRPNQWGLYDMLGNVHEWVNDWYGLYPSSPVSNPQGPSNGKERVTRGGSWTHYAKACRLAYRGSAKTGYKKSNLGFRVARDN